jgi:hypothetical protein
MLTYVPGVGDRIGDPEILKLNIGICKQLPGIVWEHWMSYIGTDTFSSFL